MKKYFLVMIFCLVTFSVVFSNTQDGKWQIGGNITNENGEPLSGVTVQVMDTYLGMYTGPDGHYEFRGLNEGVYVLLFSYMGLESIEKEIILENNMTMDISLIPASIETGEIVVKGTRATSVTPVASSVISADLLKTLNIGQDLPYMLSSIPSLVETSESGTGIGYTNFRIRGTDPSRINVTVDGIPLNDSESQQVFWVDIPDLAASLSDIQIQRGVGTSTNGAGAFGASINMHTANPSDNPFVEIGSTMGSFGTYKGSIKLGTGLLKERFKIDMRFSGITSNGYIDRSRSDHRSLFMTGVYNSKIGRFKANFIFGEEVTGISWWGVPEDSLNTNRTYNPAGQFTDVDTIINYYWDQTDNYTQTHFNLIYNKDINANLFLNLAGHYTRGLGYYEQYKEDAVLNDYGLPNLFAYPIIYEQVDLIQRKWMYNGFGGITFNLNYRDNRMNASFGGAANRYIGDHFGRIIWMRLSGRTEKDYQWYFNGASKDELNVYAKVNYYLNDRINVFGDIQYRYIDYIMAGPDDDLRDLGMQEKFNFVNPKAGIYFKAAPNQETYLSISIANREPTRADYKDAAGDLNAKPLPEVLYDFEAGYKYLSRSFLASINLYYMLYRDQLVPTGELSNVGYPIMTNVENSYRAGVEFSASLKPHERIEWNGTLTLSKNQIRDYIEYYEDFNTVLDSMVYKSKNHGDVTIAYSPSIVGNSDISVSPMKNVYLHLISKYVGKQYFDNTQSENRKIDPYLVNNIRLDYQIKFKGVEFINLQFQVNNLFNLMYESNAYGGPWYVDGNEYTWSYYFPQAGINYLFRATVRF